MSWGIWAIIAIILFILETITVDFFFLMLSLGGFAAVIAAACTHNLTIQIIVFSIVSILALFFIRPWARRHINVSGDKKETNIYAMRGRKAVALNEITEKSGRIKIGGEVWSARTEDGALIDAGAEVIVVEIDGVTAVVTGNNR